MWIASVCNYLENSLLLQLLKQMYKPWMTENTILLLLRDNLMYEITLACSKDGFQSFTWTLWTQTCSMELQKEDGWFFRDKPLWVDYLHIACTAEQQSVVLRNRQLHTLPSYTKEWNYLYKSDTKILFATTANLQISLLNFSYMFLSHFRGWEARRRGRWRSFVHGGPHILFDRMGYDLDSWLPQEWNKPVNRLVS